MTVIARYFQYDSFLLRAAKFTCLFKLYLYFSLFLSAPPNAQILSRNRVVWGGRSGQLAAGPHSLGQRLEEAVSCFAGIQCHLTIGGKKKTAGPKHSKAVFYMSCLPVPPLCPSLTPAEERWQQGKGGRGSGGQGNERLKALLPY